MAYPTRVNPRRTYEALEIEERAYSLLAGAGPIVAPVNPLVIAGARGITVLQGEFKAEDIVGIVEWEGSVRKVAVNAKLSELTKRYVIAHAIGHYTLHATEPKGAIVEDGENVLRPIEREFSPVSKENAPTERMEYEARLFTVALLMPKQLLMQVHHASGSPREASQKLQVPEEALEYRLRYLSSTSKW